MRSEPSDEARHDEVTAMRVVATAGHVDHGKSSLVLALTGTDPDRFEEEKRRGLTIDLGFAHATLPSGAGISFVDVPGHVRFVRNMLAGVGGVDACMFVVAATEGWKPQSEEHLRILELVGLRRGLVALTKVDLVDDETREIAELDVSDHVAGTFLADAPVVKVSATTGVGLDELRGALDTLVTATPGARDRDRPRLWIDRVFSPAGSGTVVTGTLTDGELAVDHTVVIEPGSQDARIRSIQTSGRAVDRIGPGHRVALNLAGVAKSDLGRGDVVVTADRWHLTDRFDARLDVLGSLDHDVSRRGAHLLYVGAREVPVKLRVLGPEQLAPGQSGTVRLFLPVELPLLPGDRFVMRESGRDETIGGGEVLDVAPVLPASRARPDRSVDRVVAERGWVEVHELELLTGERREPIVGRWVAPPELVDAISAELIEAVASAGDMGFDVAGLDERERAVLDTLEGVEVEAGRARPKGVSDPLADHPYVATVLTGGFAPPPPDDVDRGELRELIRRGDLVERDGIVFHPDAIEGAARIAAGLLAASPDGFTVSELRDALGVTRKFALPLAAELDARGMTRRRGDLRIAGPRLPDP
ncbi:MAG: selenocysteine-specific translation elongation factor [Ilumatobacter sp.]|nr:MAG: selenocysteine-specific translation elongation factor [Ilumatobacter sp.]